MWIVLCFLFVPISSKIKTFFAFREKRRGHFRPVFTQKTSAKGFLRLSTLIRGYLPTVKTRRAAAAQNRLRGKIWRSIRTTCQVVKTIPAPVKIIPALVKILPGRTRVLLGGTPVLPRGTGVCPRGTKFSAVSVPTCGEGNMTGAGKGIAQILWGAVAGRCF